MIEVDIGDIVKHEFRNKNKRWRDMKNNEVTRKIKSYEKFVYTC